jgi:predicted GTPase
MADVVVINKMDSASPDQVSEVQDAIQRVNPGATVIRANSALIVEDGEKIAGKRVLVIEDGPTLTHGEMKFGAGMVAARRADAAEIVDPRPYAVGTLEETYRKYAIGPVLPAMGYSEQQLREMEKMIDAADVDLVIVASPIDLRHLINVSKPMVRVRYELEELAGSPRIADVLSALLTGQGSQGRTGAASPAGSEGTDKGE